jgi:hypothetical protein
MGRPIKNKYINPYGINYTAGDGAQRPGIGGEGISSTSGNVILASITRGTGYYAANVSATISSPDLADGTAATVGTVYIFANGAVKGVQLTGNGRGYTGAATLTFFGANSGTASGTATVDVATTMANAILANCFFPGTSSGITTADILKQRGSRTFVVANNAGYSKTLKLVTNDANLNPYVSGTMTVIATFADASQFTVAKITDRKVYSATGNSYKWSLDPALVANVSATNVTVTLSSL